MANPVAKSGVWTAKTGTLMREDVRGMRDRGQVPVTRFCLKPGEDFSLDEFIGAVADELRDALEGLVEE